MVESNTVIRWVIYDLEFTEGSRKVSKICFIIYSPDSNTNNEEKFAIAAQKEAIKTKVSEVNRDFQVNQWKDMTEETLVSSFQN